MKGGDYHLLIKLFTFVWLATSVQALSSAVQGISASRTVYSSSPALNVYWNVVSGSGITYTVCYSTNSGTQCGPPTSASCSTGITGTYTTLTYLYSGYYYYIWVAAVSSGVQGPFSDRYQIRTYSVPGTVYLSVTPSTSAYGLIASWSTPSGTYPTPLTYRLRYRRSTYSSWSSTYTVYGRQHTISSLSSGTRYEVRVWAVSPIGSGSTASRYATTYQLPGSVTSLSASPYRYRYAFTISWGLPSGSNYPTVTYQLRYRERPSSGSPGSWSSTVQRTATQRQYTTPVLKPGTRYEAEVWAFTRIGRGPSVTSTATTYQLPGYVTSLQVRSSTTIFGLIITWGPPFGSNYPTPVTYQLRYRGRPSSGSPGDWSSTVRRTSTQRQYTTPVLKPGTRYEVEIWTVCSVGNGPKSSGTANTLQLPGSVTSLQVRPTTTIFGLIITWGPPSGSNYPTPVTYRLRYRERPYNGPLYGWSRTIYRSTYQRQYTTPVLTPGTRYEVEVWPVSSSSAGPTRQVYVTTASGAVRSLRVTPHSTQRSLIVTWQPPTDITRPSRYRLRYRKTPSGSWSSVRTISSQQTRYTITGLEATTTYEVEVWVTLGSGEGSRSRQTAIVKGVPVVQLRIDSKTANSITVIPSGPSGRVSYKEYGSSSSSTSVPYFNRIVISRLKPNTQYVISYAVTNSHGTGTTELTQSTLAEAPSSLKLTAHSSTAINATWRPPANSQSLTYYIKYSSPLTGQNTLTTGATALALTGLHPHEQYNISVQATNRAGLSLPVYAAVKTYSDRPSGAIRRIWNTQGTDWINLVWVPPSSYYRNGIIIKYVIDLSLSDDVIVDVENPAFNTPNTVNYNITGLSPGTTYTLRVAAATVNGTGPYSYRRRIKTVETAPGPVQNLTFESTSSSSVRITWEEPAVPNGVIQSYKVMYGDVNDSSTLPKTTTSKYVTLSRLEEETPYIVSVRARTSAGYGENESIIVFSKQGAPSQAVEDITVEWTSDTSVSVSWTPLSYSEAKGLPLYIITYKPQDGSSVETVNTTSSSVAITSLNPLVGYIFTVQVTTENGNNKGEPLSEFVAARLQHTDIRGSVGLFFGGLAAGLLIEVLLLGTVCGLYKRRQYRMKSQAADTAPRSASKCSESDPHSPKVDEERIYENAEEIRYMSSVPTTGLPGVRII